MKIMVCYDGSVEASRALDMAKKQAKAFGAELLAVTALEGDPKEQLHQLAEAEKVLANAKEYLSNENIHIETRMLPANALSVGENMVHLSKDEAVDMIVIGVRRKSKLGKLLFGSTVQHLILTAPCPVISVK